MFRLAMLAFLLVGVAFVGCDGGGKDAYGCDYGAALAAPACHQPLQIVSPYGYAQQPLQIVQPQHVQLQQLAYGYGAQQFRFQPLHYGVQQIARIQRQRRLPAKIVIGTGKGLGAAGRVIARPFRRPARIVVH